MRKNILISLAFCTALLSFGLMSGTANAATFNQNRIIDDALFDNTTTMSAGQINTFLNGFASSCISTNSGFQAIDPTGYNPTSGYQYGGFVTAGQVIYDAAQAYGINPQVLLVTLEKEQSLVTGKSNFAGYCNNGDQHKYAAAVGYGCPDSGTTYSYSNVNLYARNGVMVTNTGTTCVNSATKAGFTQQVIRAAWLLKFGEQRSKGNVGWAVIKGNWNNSDDPQTCYGGPMTQGTWQRCPSGSAAFYDGYTTIDSTAVHMDDGATAALYWYTPHFHGNQVFFSLFSSWFGSTTYKEPVSSLILSGNQSGKLYFVSLDNNTIYHIPTWSTFLAYGLNQYQIIPTDDSALSAYANGGELKTLVYNNNDQKIYLVDGGKRYWFQQYCAEWGLDCLNQTPGSVSFMTSTYFDTYITMVGKSQPLQQSNGVYYLMQAGSRKPIMDPAALQTTGYTSTQSVTIQQSDLNGSQPLGTLIATTPAFLQFSPNPQLLYFDGQSYHHVPDYSVYQAWGSKPIATPPTSSYNTTLPSLGSSLTIWAQSATNHKYVVDSGRKIDITGVFNNWYSGTALTYMNTLLDSLPAVGGTNNISANGGIYVVQNGSKRHVPTYDDYLWLGINATNTTAISPYTAAQINNGPDILREGGLFTVVGNPGLYVTNGLGSFHIPNTDTFNDYGFNWSLIHFNLDPTVLSNGYPSQGELGHWIHPAGGNLAYVTTKQLLVIGTTVAQQWGVNLGNGAYPSMGLAALTGTSTKNLGQFVQDRTTGGIYYGSGGTSHYVASYNTFVSLGGLQSYVPLVDHDFLSGMPAGAVLN